MEHGRHDKRKETFSSTGGFVLSYVNGTAHKHSFLMGRPKEELGLYVYEYLITAFKSQMIISKYLTRHKVFIFF